MGQTAHKAIPDDFTAIRRAHRAEAVELLRELGLHEGELVACIEADESYRAGGLSRESFVGILEAAISDRPDLADAIRTIWATAWHDDSVETL